MILSSCGLGSKEGADLSKDEIAYVQSLGILGEDEKIILFNSQLDTETSGNFISDKRLASYWIDKRDNSKTKVSYVYYEDIDTIVFKNLYKSLTYASFLEVVKKSGGKMRIYVDGDSSVVWHFYNVANRERNKNFNR